MHSKFLFVFAGTFAEFRYWQDKNINSFNVKYLANLNSIRGIECPKVIYYGTFKFREDYDEIENYLKIQKSIHKDDEDLSKKEYDDIIKILEREKSKVKYFKTDAEFTESYEFACHNIKLKIPISGSIWKFASMSDTGKEKKKSYRNFSLHLFEAGDFFLVKK